MIPKKDIYVDKDDKITDDPEKYAAQVAISGVTLDERVAKRYGIEDVLVSVDEPATSRRVSNASSVHIQKKEDEEEAESEPTETDAEAAEPKAKKGAKKK